MSSHKSKDDLSIRSKSNINIVLSSSWEVESNNSLENTISINNSVKSVDLEDVVQLDTCVHLVQSAKGDKLKESCSVTIAMKEGSTQLLTQAVIVSEARIIELFGSHGEYLTTCSAEYVDEFEDCAVYMAEVSVKPSRELLVKFQKTKNEDSLWVYGINLRLCQSQSSVPPMASINFQSVNEMLKDAKVPLSENAEKCMSFLQAYGTPLQNSQQPFRSRMPDPQMLTKMLEAGYFHPLGETGKNMSRCISNFVPFLSKDEENQVPQDSCSNGSNSAELSDVLVLKHYIDQRFSQIERKIDRFEQKMRELEIKQSEKLDCIIDLLKKSCS